MRPETWGASAIIGTASAWFLKREGYDVTVIDRQPGAAQETSFANGGQISVSHAEPWANPSAPLKVLQWLGKEDAPLLFRIRADMRQWLWGLQFLRECTPARTRHNIEQIVRLGTYSRDTLQQLRRDIGISYDERMQGILHFYTSQKEFDGAEGPAAQMRALGAIPQVMAFSELYQALQSGVVDGTEGTPSNIYTQKIFEVQKHITLSNHGHLAYAVVINKKFYDGLPADIRGVFDSAMRDATTYANAIAATENALSLDKIKASGKSTVYTPTEAELLEWKKTLMPVHKDMEARLGKATIDAAYKAAGFVAPK